MTLNRRLPWAVHDANFSQQSFGTGPWPDQGWKLHVSATSLSAIAVLEAALDVLLRDGARFKVLNSIRLLTAANNGLFGISEIGKFITVYPSDNSHAVRSAFPVKVAILLQRVWVGGPFRIGEDYRKGASRRWYLEAVQRSGGIKGAPC